MIKLYDTVKIKKSGKLGVVVDIDNNNNTSPDIYLIELVENPENFDLRDVLFWCDYSEVLKYNTK